MIFDLSDDQSKQTKKKRKQNNNKKIKCTTKNKGSKYTEMDDSINILPFWNEEEQETFRQSSCLHFHLPFNNVKEQDVISIDCEYVESLEIVEGYYCLRIPLQFYDWELKSPLLEGETKENEQCSVSNETNLEFERRVKVLVFNGSYLVTSENKNNNSSNLSIREMKVGECYAFCDGNEIKHNHLFPMEMLLANEEINYWDGDYWYKQNNCVFKEYAYGSRVNAVKEANPFAIFGSVTKEQSQEVIGDLSDQTGIASKFRPMVSFRISTEKFDEMSKQTDDEIKQSRNGDVSLSSQSETKLSNINNLMQEKVSQKKCK